jgi:hypothetical protein
MRYRRNSEKPFRTSKVKICYTTEPRSTIMKLTQNIHQGIKQLAIIVLLAISITGGQINAQTPPPPPPPNTGTNAGHGLGGNQGAPGAPIGGGLEIILVLGLAYAGHKWNKASKETNEEL